MKKFRIFAAATMLSMCAAVTAQNVITLDQLQKQQQQQPAQQQEQYQYREKSSSNSDVEKFSTFYAQYNISSMKAKYEGESHSESLNAVTLGYNIAFPIAGETPLYLESGIAAQYFFKSKDGVKFNMVSAKIPLNVLFAVQIGEAISLDPFAGLYLRGNIWGQQKYEGETFNIFKDFEDGGMEAKRVQFGFQIGLRARFNHAFTIGINYGQDLNNFAEHTKINSIDLTLGLNF